jgi:hypothetical protein
MLFNVRVSIAINSDKTMVCLQSWSQVYQKHIAAGLAWHWIIRRNQTWERKKNGIEKLEVQRKSSFSRFALSAQTAERLLCSNTFGKNIESVCFVCFTCEDHLCVCKSYWSRRLNHWEMSHKNVKLSPSEMDKKVEELREWIDTQPELPKNIGKNIWASLRHHR